MYKIGLLIHFFVDGNNLHMDSIPNRQGLSAKFEFVDMKRRISYNFHNEGCLQEKVE